MKRVQRKRTKGWRMPENTVYVGRPTMYGNPWSMSDSDVQYYLNVVTPKGSRSVETAKMQKQIVAQYHAWLLEPPQRDLRRAMIEDLRDKDLACWCRLDAPCHADVIIEYINGLDELMEICDEVSAEKKES
jgi:hypothetical protein